MPMARRAAGPRGQAEEAPQLVRAATPPSPKPRKAEAMKDRAGRFSRRRRIQGTTTRLDRARETSVPAAGPHAATHTASDTLRATLRRASAQTRGATTA